MISRYPRFSIVTATLNSAEFVSTNISSLLSQTFGDWEQVVVDGYSTDGTEQIVKEFSGSDERIRLIKAPAKGIADAYNVGLMYASGEYVLFLNGDDFLFNNRVLAGIDAFLESGQRPGLMVGQTVTCMVDGTPIKARPRSIWKYVGFHSILHRVLNYLPFPSCFFRRDRIQHLFDPTLKLAMDYDFLLKFGSSNKVAVTTIPVTVFQVHRRSASSAPHRLTSIWRQSFREHLRILQRLVEPRSKRWTSAIFYVIAASMKLYSVNVSKTIRSSSSILKTVFKRLRNLQR